MSNQVYNNSNSKYFESVRNVTTEMSDQQLVAANGGSAETVTVSYSVVNNSGSFEVDANHKIKIKKSGMFSLIGSVEIEDSVNPTTVDCDIGLFFYNETKNQILGTNVYRLPAKGVTVGSTSRVVSNSLCVYLEAGDLCEFRLTNFTPSVLKIKKTNLSKLMITRVY